MKLRHTAYVFAAALGVVISGAGAALADGHGSMKDGHVASSCGHGHFQGSYIGLHGGYGRHSTDADGAGNADGDDDDRGWFGGFHSGYDYQCGRWVIGYQSDTSFGSMETSVTTPASATQTLHSDITTLSTLRGRIGVTLNPHTLFYATAGLAFANIDYEIVDTSATGLSDSTDDFVFGFAVGGGVEFKRRNWRIRADLLYIDLREESQRFTGSASCTGTCVADVDIDDDFFVGRIGVSYDFNLFDMFRRTPSPEPLG
ncbi:MAG: outer membrane beta-barrel protein [Pseudomonadota bacterium]